MRKRMITPASENQTIPDQSWLDVEELAQVEITSEDREHSIEGALVPGAESWWRAAQPGAQTIRLIFDRLQRLSRMRLVFIEPDVARAQEFVLRWSADGGRTFREILRQQ